MYISQILSLGTKSTWTFSFWNTAMRLKFLTQRFLYKIEHSYYSKVENILPLVKATNVQMTVQNPELWDTSQFYQIICNTFFFSILKWTEYVNLFSASFIWHFSCQLCFMLIYLVNYFCVGSSEIAQLPSCPKTRLSHVFCSCMQD